MKGAVVAAVNPEGSDPEEWKPDEERPVPSSEPCVIEAGRG
jgi:hypothetical protein